MFKQTQLKAGGFSKEMQELLEQSLLESGITDAKNIVNSEYNIGSDFSDDQRKAFELFKKGKNVLIIASGGCGKSFLVKNMQEYVATSGDYKNIYVTSTTGVSAFNISGCTIHSFMGIGTGESDLAYLIRKLMRNKIAIDRLRATDILIIDEISMLSAELFEKINRLCQHFRKSKKFFGGIQVVFTGDPLQLTPVFNKGLDQDIRLIIESQNFIDAFKDTTIVLNKNFRQFGDANFTELLLRVRLGQQTADDISILKKRMVYTDTESKDSVCLVSSNKKAKVINDTCLKNLPGPDYTFTADFKKGVKRNETYNILQKDLENQFKQKGIDIITLRLGARVLLLKNLDVNLGLVNGAIGTIIQFNGGYPLIEFDTGIKQLITSVEWELELDSNIVKCTQVPLMLAYSLTCHRCQSLTIDSAVMDLSDAFCEGQIYMALSRVRTLDGLYLKSFDEKKIKVNSKMKEFVDSFSKHQ
jgi:ATP-dependent DNA helicase PIF1